jgi:hypothetical protein
VKPAEALGLFASVLDEADVPYMLTGSHAGALYGTPRPKCDLDFVVDSQPDAAAGWARLLSSRCCWVDEDALAAPNPSGFNAVHLGSGWKGDFIFRKPRPFSDAEFDRRRRAILYGVEISVASPEDLVIALLEWAKLGSPRQIEDVRGILHVRGDRIDRAYIEGWARQLGLQSQWEAAQGDA